MRTGGGSSEPSPEPLAVVQAWGGAGEGSGGKHQQQQHLTCSFSPGEGESDQIQELGERGLAGSWGGKAMPPAILCESRLLRRVCAPCSQPLLPSQSACPARGVQDAIWVRWAVSSLADSLPCRCTCEDEREGGRLPGETIAPLPFLLLPVRGLECNETLFQTNS